MLFATVAGSPFRIPKKGISLATDARLGVPNHQLRCRNLFIDQDHVPGMSTVAIKRGLNWKSINLSSAEKHAICTKLYSASILSLNVIKKTNHGSSYHLEFCALRFISRMSSILQVKY